MRVRERPGERAFAFFRHRDERLGHRQAGADERREPAEPGRELPRRHPATRRTGQEAVADQEGLGDLLDRLAFLTDGDRET